MRIRFVVSQLGLLFVVLSAIMLGLAGIFFGASLLTRHEVDAAARVALLITGASGLVVGGAAWLLSRAPSAHLGRREALLLVGLSWLIGAAFAAVPYFLWAQFSGEDETGHPFRNFADCYFEAMSGLTTTGATVLGPPHDIENIPPSLLLWRSFTHWLGGLGIVVLFVAVFPSLGVSAKRLFRMETTGPTKAGVLPNIRDTVRTLWYIYLGMTVASILALWLATPMNFFDSVCHTFSMVSTGGLSTRDASIAAYDSLALDIICCVAMLAAGVNFGLFYQMTRGRFDVAWKDTELRVYVMLKVVVLLVVAVELFQAGDPIITTAGKVVPPTAGESVRYATFQTIALHTGTGFCTADYDLWPFLSRGLLIGLMFVGGCAGSTAGGVKVIRLWIMLKVMLTELERAFRPHVVRPVKVSSGTITPDLKLASVVYVLMLLLMFGAGTILIQWFEGSPEDGGRCDFLTAMSASLSTLCNVGPGLHAVGPTQNYGWFGAEAKLVMSVLMLFGRIEMFAILVLMHPRFWRGD